jgi:hypothetical protein
MFEKTNGHLDCIYVPLILMQYTLAELRFLPMHGLTVGIIQT